MHGLGRIPVVIANISVMKSPSFIRPTYGVSQRTQEKHDYRECNPWMIRDPVAKRMGFKGGVGIV